MTVTVLPRHITLGDRGNAFHNPIALAMQEIDPFAVVTKTKIHLMAGVFDLPQSAQWWMKQFNAFEQVSQLQFFLGLGG